MKPLELALLSLGLAMDATAVAAARGLAARSVRARDALLLALLFGGFQAGMPALGWLVGMRLGGLATRFGPYIAFALLALVGGKMLWEARKVDDEEQSPDAASFRPTVLLVLAVATSIDALAVGVTLPLLHAPLGSTVLVIGLVTFALSLAGLYLGRFLGKHVGRRLDVVGGLVLLGLAVRFLLPALHR